MVDDSEVDTVRLETISYARLLAQEPLETARLLKAAESPGFFYLDLKDGSTSQMLADVQDIYPLTEQYFDQPQELKMEHYREDQDRG
jgi:isopenicillin N synthase-like dioxygenase